MAFLKTYSQIVTETEVTLKLQTLSILKKLDIRAIELSIINLWLKDHYQDEIKRYSTSLPEKEIRKEESKPKEDIWGPTCKACKTLRVTSSDLYAMRKVKELKEGVHYKRLKTGGKYGSLKYNLSACAEVLYHISYERLTAPDFDFKEHRRKMFEETYERVTQINNSLQLVAVREKA